MTVEVLTIEDLKKVEEMKKTISVLFSSLFNFIDRLPNSRNKSIAFTHMEDCMMRVERALMIKLFNDEKVKNEVKEEVKESQCPIES